MLEVKVPRTSHSREPARLFVVDTGDPEEEGIVEAMRRFTEDAWHGRKPKLARFSLDSLRPGLDASGPASRAGDIRQAA